MDLAAEVAWLATDFSGVVRVDRAGTTVLDAAFGLADRRHALPMTVDSQVAMASGCKGMTALAVMSLVEDRTLTLDTTARSLLRDDLPLIADDVTVEHLLAHRSGIGDYLDENVESDIDDYALPVPMQELATTEQFLAVLDGFPTAFPAGERFAYCNGGFLVLALLAERASGTGFHELVDDRVLRPAGMVDSGYLRSDELPGRAAVGYVRRDGRWRTNVFHLPVRGNGDGGMYTTTADMHRFWTALHAGAIVSLDTLALMTSPRSDVPQERQSYGLGFWLHGSRAIPSLAGYDAGVSFRSFHDPVEQLTATVVATTAAGAWPIARLLEERLVTTSPGVSPSTEVPPTSPA
ncbi:serine hydrolase [Cellulomonas sp. URHD0024]|uniref:serine hydrolase domain-containing protein n=1 Tax=Cellulomonas sp. URHD0024 TaxID=1302620 RepID=UPI00068642A8|nr:serine hydrolase domain-containing protein [Cellulomonas sp. URHD0024]